MRRRRRLIVCAVGVSTVGYGWWAVGLPPFTATSVIAVVGAGVVAMVAGYVRQPAGRLPPLAVGAVGWLVLLAALGAWQLLAYVQEPRSAHPTLSSLANAALDTRGGRTLAFVAWLVGGHRLARR